MYDVYLHSLQTGATSRVSVGSDEGQSVGVSLGGSVSGNGRFVAFGATADDLVPGDTNGKWDVLVRDRQTGTTLLVSKGRGGVPADGDSSRFPTITANGRHVAFTAAATNLVEDDTNGLGDVFLAMRFAEPVA